MATTSRVVPGKNQDNTGRNITQDYQAPAYAATIAITPTAQKTDVAVGQLTGAATINIGVGSSTSAPYVGDEIVFLFGADSGANRVVTFGTGFASAGTLTVTLSKYASAKFKFNGTVWVEMSRAITA